MATDGRTDGQTDRITISISHVSSSMLTRDKNDAAPHKSIRLIVTMMMSDDDDNECNTNITMKQ